MLNFEFKTQQSLLQSNGLLYFQIITISGKILVRQLLDFKYNLACASFDILVSSVSKPFFMAIRGSSLNVNI